MDKNDGWKTYSASDEDDSFIREHQDPKSDSDLDVNLERYKDPH